MVVDIRPEIAKIDKLRRFKIAGVPTKTSGSKKVVYLIAIPIYECIRIILMNTNLKY